MKRAILTLTFLFLGIVVFAMPTRSMMAARNIIIESESQVEEPYGGLCFTAFEPNVVVNMRKTGSPPEVTLETSRNGVNWIPFDADGGTTPIILVTIGSHVYFRASDSGNARLSLNGSNYRSFTLSGLCSARGDATSLLSREFPIMSFSQEYAMCRLFSGCTYLVTAPTLPTTSLNSYCYYYMFAECSSLTIVPSLPSLKAIQGCYQGMFYGCTALVKAPELPNSVAINCFREMFRNCTSLVVAPEIKHAATSQACYNSMFRGCSSLNDIKVAFTTFSGSNQNIWLDGVAAMGTFRCPTALGTNETIARGVAACPTGWTVVNVD